MIMVKNTIFSVFIALTLFACNSKNNIEIRGEIKNADKQKVYLEQVNVDNIIVVDSAKTDKNGSFKFKTTVTSPTFYNVKIGTGGFVTILAAPGDEKIELTGTLDDLKNDYWVDGSEGSLWIKLLNYQLNNTKTALDSLQKVYATIPPVLENADKREAVAAQYDSIIAKQIKFSKDFILKNATSPAAYYALYQQFDNEHYVLEPLTDLHSYKVVASSLKAMFPESQYTTAILKHLDQINRDLQALKMREFITNSENNLPEIQLPDAKGDTIALSSLRGKYILLDFVVLNTPETEAYIQDLKSIYNKYKSKGFQIYQVCLDSNQGRWEELVRKYGIDWICVRDADALQSRVARVWNVSSVPANYIINKQYEIAGKNLSGQRLNDRLNDILK